MLSCAAGSSSSPRLRINGSFPRLILSEQDIVCMRSNALSGEEPFASCYRELAEACAPALSGEWHAEPYPGEDGMSFYKGGQRDGGMARDLSILWQITRDSSYARAAVDILDAWTSADVLPGTRLPETEDVHAIGMLVSRGILPFLYAYDLLTADRIVPPGIQARFCRWLEALVPVIKLGERQWEENDYFDKQYWQNHVAAATTGLLAIAVTLDDAALAQYALSSPDNERDLLELVQGCILMEGDEPWYREPGDWPVHNGEVYDRYRHFAIGGHYKDYVTKPDRGLQYCNLTGSLLVIAAEICRNNGFDLYGWTGEHGERIPLIWDHYARYYATHDCSGSIYSGEEWYINHNDEATSASWEVANARFPHNRDYEGVLVANDRTKYNNMHLFGPVVLTHGREIK